MTWDPDFGDPSVELRGNRDAESEPKILEPDGDDDTVSRIEIAFMHPVIMSEDEYRTLVELIDKIARANTPEGHVHWLAGQGSKPRLSQADARFLGRPVDPTAPESGEPTFDHSVLYFETHCRERHDNEPVRKRSGRQDGAK